MFKVTIIARDVKTSYRTANPQALVKSILDNWRSRGYWVQEPLPGFGEEYISYKDGKRAATLKVEEIQDGNKRNKT